MTGTLLGHLRDVYVRFRVPVAMALLQWIASKSVAGASGEHQRPEGSSEAP